jgi:hypothetical protein
LRVLALSNDEDDTCIFSKEDNWFELE